MVRSTVIMRLSTKHSSWLTRRLDRKRVSREIILTTGTRHLFFLWVRMKEIVFFTGLQKSARELPIEISIAEDVRDVKHFLTRIVRDVTDRKRSEEGLQAR